MKSALIKTVIVFIMITITIHFHQTLLSAKQSYNLMQTATYPTPVVQPLLF